MEKYKRYAISMEEYANGKRTKELVTEILEDKELPEISSITIGSWGNVHESSCQPIIDMFVENKEKFAHVDGLIIGHIDSDECELSQIKQGNYSELFQAMPQLKYLIIQGSSGLSLGQMAHDNLTHFLIQSAGLSASVLEELRQAKLPNLEQLILYLGTRRYGFNGTMEHIRSLVKKELFPKLQVLGLMSSTRQDEIAKIVVESDLVTQLVELELGRGVLSDKGGKVILDHIDEMPHLQRLDLNGHYMSKEVMEQFEKLPIEVDLGGAEDPDDLGVIGGSLEEYRLSWEEYYKEGKKIEDLIDTILNDQELPEITAITIGNWGGSYETSCQPIIDMFVKHKEKFAHIESLFIGDIDQEECEVSWIKQGDYSELYQALPQLRLLMIKGSNDLKLGKIEHDNLTHLQIICGGLPCGVLEEISNAKLPNLRSLILYLGVDDYGFNGTINSIRPILKKDLFPKLKELGLVDSDMQDEVAKLVLESDILPQLEELMLCYGTLGDEGGKVLLDHAERLSHLKYLNLYHHYMSEEIMEQFRKLPIKVNLEDAGEPEEEYMEDRWPILTE